MSWRQIYCALRSGRLTVTFLVLETVLACAFICNALFFIVYQAGPMLAPTGVAPNQVLVVDKIFSGRLASKAYRVKLAGVSVADLQTLEAHVRGLRGVMAVSLVMYAGIGHVPYGEGNGGTAYHAKGSSTSVPVSEYQGDSLLKAFGLTLVKGRGFSSTEIAVSHAGVVTDKGVSVNLSQVAKPHVAIITQSLARQLFPDGRALGHRLYSGKYGKRPGPVVVGIVRRMPSAQPVVASRPDASVVLPVIQTGVMSTGSIGLVVRVKAPDRAGVAKALPGVIAQSVSLNTHPPRVRTFESLHDDYFQPNRTKTWLMLAVTLAVLVINVIAIAGLTSFWVQRRTRSIGIRRALGATRGTVLRYFLAENLVVVGAGVILGVIAAYAGNAWLMTHLELAPLPWWWLVIGGVLLCVLGQLSALVPAFGAARVPPGVATRGLRRMRAT